MSQPEAPSKKGDEMPPISPCKMSVVIAPDQESVCLEKVMDAFAAQTVNMAEHEVLIVNAVHTPANDAAVARIKPSAAARVNLRVFQIDKAGRARARNFGIQQATGDLVLLLADDFVPEPQLVEEHLRFHDAQPAEHLVGIGPAFFPESLRRDPFTRWLEDSGRLFGRSFTWPKARVLEKFFYGANTSLKRSLLDRSGLFDEAFPFHTTDDYELGVRLKRLGMQTVYLPNARAMHEHEHVITLPERWKAMWETGYSLAIFERRHPDHRKPSAKYPHHPWVYRLSALRWRILHLVSRSKSYRKNYWRDSLALAVVQGYREAQRPAGSRQRRQLREDPADACARGHGEVGRSAESD